MYAAQQLESVTVDRCPVFRSSDILSIFHEMSRNELFSRFCVPDEIFTFWINANTPYNLCPFPPSLAFDDKQWARSIDFTANV